MEVRKLDIEQIVLKWVVYLYAYEVILTTVVYLAAQSFLCRGKI